MSTSHPSTTKIKVVGVDVGYFSTKVAWRLSARREIQLTHFISLAPVLVKGLPFKHSAADGVPVEVGGVEYFVGPNAQLAASADLKRLVPKDFCQTDEYAALTLGALHAVAKDALAARSSANPRLEVGRLVLGLPISTYSMFSGALTKRFIGDFKIPPVAPGGAPVTVSILNACVEPQPMGGLHDYSSITKLTPKGRGLLIDMGGGTIDWLATKGAEPLPRQSGAHNRGMLACAEAVAGSISPHLRDDELAVGRVDEALRKGAKTVQVGAQTIVLEKHLPHARSVLSHALSSISQTSRLEGNEVVVVSGGGANFLRAELVKRFPSVEPVIYTPPEPMYSNARGFLIMGELDEQ